ncbi:MAG: molybdopterin-dependent oxidoreductase [Lautropia sp.]|nr:molybdopterin-dependent oxidoreductase [Lautropia sp.]
MLTVETLQQFKPVSIEQIPITSASGSPRGELKQLVGVPLRDLLDKAEIQLDSRHDSKKIAIIASGTDDYRVIFSWSEIYNTRVGEGVIVFYQQEGRPLPDRSGRIALISRDDLRTGPRHVKWLNDIEVRKIVD